MMTYILYGLIALIVGASIIIYFSNNALERDSWHYKVVFWFDKSLLWDYWNDKHVDKIPLCPYFRTLLLAIFVSTLGIIGMCIGAWIMIYTLIWGFTGVETSVPEAISGIMLWSAAGFLLLLTSKYLPKSKYNPTINLPFILGNTTKSKEPSLLKLYIKALHDKVCPIVDIKD